jgi:hypothetical protein
MDNSNRRFRWRWVVWVALVVLATFGLTVAFLISHAEPILRGRVIETLSTRFRSKVELQGFHVWLAHGLEVSGEGLKIYGKTDPNIHQLGVQPLIAIEEFRFRTGLLSLFRSPMHMQTVRLIGGLKMLVPANHFTLMRT